MGWGWGWGWRDAGKAGGLGRRLLFRFEATSKALPLCVDVCLFGGVGVGDVLHRSMSYHE